MANRGGVRLWPLVLAAILLAFFASLADFGALAPAGDAARQASCINNCHQLGLAARMYVEDHDGNYPPSVSALLEPYITAQKVLICPSAWDRIPEGFPDDASLKTADPKLLAQADEFGSYVLAKGCAKGRPADWIVIYDKDGAHGGRGRVVVLMDGSVQWLPEAAFLVRMQKQEATVAGVTPPDLGPVPETAGRDPMAVVNTFVVLVFVAILLAGIIFLMVRQKQLNVTLGCGAGVFILLYIAAIAGWVVAGGYLGHSIQEACNRENRARLVGFAATRYAWDHGGAYPAELSALLNEGYVTRPALLVDSGWALPAGRPYSEGVIAGVADGGPYVPAPGVKQAGRADVLVLYESGGWGARWCYFDDGHLDRLSGSEIDKRLGRP